MTKPFAQERFGTPYTLLLVRYLLRSGRHQEAEGILHRLHREADSLPDEVSAELRLLELWLAGSFPAVAEHFPYDHGPDVRRGGPVTGRDELQWQAARLLVGVLSGGADSGLISEVEQVLRLYQVAEATVEPLVMGLSALIFADRLDSAGSWCTSLMDDIETVDAPAWHASLSALRAEIAVRQGDLKGAVRFAERAIDDIGADGWGVEIGAPSPLWCSPMWRWGGWRRPTPCSNFLRPGPCTRADMACSTGTHGLITISPPTAPTPHCGTSTTAVP